jgi:hypothetical protein
MSDQTSLREQVYQFFWQEMQSGILAPGASINILKKILMPIKRRLNIFSQTRLYKRMGNDKHRRA